MKRVSSEHLRARIRAENPWWHGEGFGTDLGARAPRAYFGLFSPLVVERDGPRAVALLGPRRVGKTVLLHHAIQRLLEQGTPPTRIAYVSLDHPLCAGADLGSLVDAAGYAASGGGADLAYVFFDGVEHRRGWEVQVAALLDARPSIRIIACGSVAPTATQQGRQAARDEPAYIMLPPVTFHEYLELTGFGGLMTEEGVDGGSRYRAVDLAVLNERFIDYLDHGAYPGMAVAGAGGTGPSPTLAGDLVDRALLHELPGLYGIGDVQELNRLLTTLALNTAGELSLQDLASNSGAVKNTLKRYLEYLEAAFLIRMVHRVDESAQPFRRARTFKVYLTNPSLRAALLPPMEAESSELDALVETAVFAQYPPDEAASVSFGRWEKGRVDVVRFGATRKPVQAMNVRWSDHLLHRPGELHALVAFCRGNGLAEGWVTSRTRRMMQPGGGRDGIDLRFVPAAELCYTIGREALAGGIAAFTIRPET